MQCKHYVNVGKRNYLSVYFCLFLMVDAQRQLERRRVEKNERTLSQGSIKLLALRKNPKCFDH